MHDIVDTSFDKLINKIKTSIKMCAVVKEHIINELNNTRTEIQTEYSNKLYDLYKDTFEDITPKYINYDDINKDYEEEK